MLTQLRDLWTLAPAQRDHYPAARIALGVAAPLLALLATGHPQLSLFAIFGAFTGLYGRHEPWKQRLRAQTRGAAVLLGGVAAGLGLAALHASPFQTVLATAAGGGLAAALSLRLGLRPAGAVFPVFGISTLASVPGLPAAAGFAIAVGAALWCLALGVAGALYSRRVRPEELKPAPAEDHPLWGVLRFGLRYVLALTLAGSVSLLAGLGHLNWALTSAAAVLGVLGQDARIRRGFQRMLGTAAGLLLAALALGLGLPAWASVGLVIALQFFAQLFIVRNYALGLVFLTPLAMLMTQLAAPSPLLTLLETRLLETVIGSLCALLFVLLMPYRTARDRRHWRWSTQARPERGPQHPEPGEQRER